MNRLKQSFKLKKILTNQVLGVRPKAQQGTTLAGWLTVRRAELIKLANLVNTQPTVSTPLALLGGLLGEFTWLWAGEKIFRELWEEN